MTAGWGMVGEPLPLSGQVRRFCKACGEFTLHVMVDNKEECENHPYGFEGDDDEDQDDDGGSEGDDDE